MKKVFIVAFSIASFIFMAGTSKSQTVNKIRSTSQANHSKNVLAQSVRQWPTSQVCMINNKFMNKEQIKVPVDGKTYYGCCEACVAGLKNNATLRHSKDPLTNESVDKATAFIILKPGSKDEVLYFGSEANAKKYIEQEK